MAIGEVVRRLREEQGVSQTALALRAGTSQAAISDIERGRVSPTIDTADRLLLCLGHQLRLEPVPRPMDADIDSLRALRALTPEQRLTRVVRGASFIRRGRATLREVDGAA